MRWSAAAAIVAVAGCTSASSTGPSTANTSSVVSSDVPDATDQTPATFASQVATPRFDFMGSRVKTYDDLKSLAEDSSNVVIAEATGKTREVPLPDFAQNPNVESAPNVMVTVTVRQVLSGEDITVGDAIEVVSFGDDVDGVASLAKSGRYLLFLAPIFSSSLIGRQ